MYICEYSFEKEDSDNPGYSHHEVDYYAWIPYVKSRLQGEMPNHRLSLRKNLVSGEFEIYRAYHRGTDIRRIQAGGESGLMITNTPSGVEEVAFHGAFEEALRFGNNEYNRWHEVDDPDRDPDKPCRHEYPERSSWCPRGDRR